jgi:Na+-driven multidrug efflux pump
MDNFAGLLGMITVSMGFFASTYISMEFRDRNVAKAKMVAVVTYIYSVTLHIISGLVAYILVK